MTNLRCTADHHAVSPLNIRPEESGIIPDHFQPIEKLIPLTTTSQSGLDQPPLYFRPTYALPDQGPLIADPFIFPERERAGVDRVSGVNGPLRDTWIKLIEPLRDNTFQIDYGYMCFWTECQTLSTFLISM